MFKKRLSLLLACMMLSFTTYASMLPIRDVATQLDASVEYDNDSKTVVLTTDDVTLKIDLTNNTVTDQDGKSIKGVNVYVENGTTYIDDQAIIGTVKNAKSNKFITDFIQSIANIVYYAVDATANLAKSVVDSAERQPVTTSSSNNSSSSSSPSATTTTSQPYELVNVNAKVAYCTTTTSGFRLIAQQTTSGAYGAEQYTWVACGVKINCPTSAEFDAELWINGQKADSHYNSGNYQPSDNYWVFQCCAKDTKIKQGDEIEMRIKSFGTYKFTVDKVPYNQYLKPPTDDFIQQSDSYFLFVAAAKNK